MSSVNGAPPLPPLTPDQEMKAIVDGILDRASSHRETAEELARCCACRFEWTRNADKPLEECEYHKDLRELAHRILCQHPRA